MFLSKILIFENYIKELNSLEIVSITFIFIKIYFSLHLPHSTGYMDAVGICPNGTSTNMESPHSAVPPTETPPPGYMSEDGDPIDPNDNMSKYRFVAIIYLPRSAECLDYMTLEFFATFHFIDYLLRDVIQASDVTSLGLLLNFVNFV